MTEKKFMQKELAKADFTHRDAKKAFRFWIVVHTDEGGYMENDYTVHIWENGDFTISDNDGESFISLHGEIAKAIIDVLTITHDA